MNSQHCHNNAYPTVATIIGCPEELAGADGLVATPLMMDTSLPDVDDCDDSMNGMSEDTSSIKDPIQKALIDNILGKVPTKNEPEKFKCELCNVEAPSMSALKVHLSGAKHQKKVKEDDADKEEVDSPYINYLEDKKIYICTLCNTTLNARTQMKMHLNGNKHKAKLEAENTEQKESKEDTDPAKPKVDATLNLRFCATCGVNVNSETQLQQHIASQKHINRVNGVNPPTRGGFRGRGGRWNSGNRGGRSAPYPGKNGGGIGGGGGGGGPFSSFQPMKKSFYSRNASNFQNKLPQPPPLMSGRSFQFPSLGGGYREPEVPPMYFRRREGNYMDNDFGDGIGGGIGGGGGFGGGLGGGYNNAPTVYNRRQGNMYNREEPYVPRGDFSEKNDNWNRRGGWYAMDQQTQAFKRPIL